MSESARKQREGPRWLSWAILLVLLGVALALRWRYIREISLSVDEFNTIWAARQVWLRGLPIFPSGNLYPHGFVFTYLEVPFVLGAFNEMVARIPGLLVGLAMLPVAYWVGRRLFSDSVGLVAAAALAVDPDCIIWGGRARMYGLLQLLTLLVIYLYYRGVADDRPRDRYLAMGLLVAAIFSHAEAALLLPALAVATLLVWPWRRIFRWSTVLPFVMAATGAGAFFLMSKYGQQGHLDIIQETRPYLGFSADILSGPRIFASFFTDPHRLLFTLLALVGLYFLFRPRFERRSPLTYLYVVLSAVLIPLVFMAGPTWQNQRYLFMLLPLLFLIGGEVLVRLLGLLPALRPTRRWQSAVLSLLVVLYVGLTGTHLAYQDELGYDQAFDYLRSQWAPDAGDRVITLSPSACVLYLQDCDRFAIQRGYEEFVVSRPGDGLLADLWTATPLLTDTSDFVDLLSTAPRVWFVVDSWRLQTRYEPDFIQTVLDQMELVYNERRVMIFRGEGYAPPSPPAVQRERQANFGDELAFTGFGLSPSNPNPGDELEVALYWQALEEAGPAYTAFLHLLAADGTGVAGTDEPVLQGLYQPDLWPRGAILTDRHRLALPSDLAPGRYRLDLGLYPSEQPEQLLPVEGSDRLPLASLTVGSAVASPPSTSADLLFGEQMRLVGFDLGCDAAPGVCNLQLQWQGVQWMDRDYTVFVHLLAPDGVFVSQDDAPPGGAFFPTSTWLPGDTVLDPHRLELPAEISPGEYTVVVGVYHRPSGDRLEAVDGDGQSLGDAVPLSTLLLGEQVP